MATQLSNEVLDKFKQALEDIMVGGLCIELDSVHNNGATFRLHLTDEKGYRVACVFTKTLSAGDSVTMTGMHKALMVTLG